MDRPPAGSLQEIYAGSIGTLAVFTNATLSIDERLVEEARKVATTTRLAPPRWLLRCSERPSDHPEPSWAPDSLRYRPGMSSSTISTGTRYVCAVPPRWLVK